MASAPPAEIVSPAPFETRTGSVTQHEPDVNGPGGKLTDGEHGNQPSSTGNLLRVRYWVACVTAVSGIGLFIGASWISPKVFPTTWIGFILLFLVVCRCRSTAAMAAGTLSGLVALSWAFWWGPSTLALQFDLSPWISRFLFVGVMLWEAVPIGIMCLLAARTLRDRLDRLWTIPVAWIALEYFWPKFFPWTMAYSQTEFTTLLQVAEFGGAGLISGCLIAACLVPAAMLRVTKTPASPADQRCVMWYAGTVAAVLITTLGFGSYRIRAVDNAANEGSGFSAALVQVDPSYTDSIEKMRQRSLAISQPVDLICWPESTLGNYRRDITDFRDDDHTRALSMAPFVDQHPAKGLPGDLIAGGKTFSPGASEEGPYLQTAFLIGPENETILGRYDKRTLLPVGEYFPGQQYFPELRKWANLSDDIVCGHDATTLSLRCGARLGVLMCYEDMVPENARESVRNGAQALLCLMNGSAFPHELTLEQHARLAMLRAVENDRYFLRCAATGVSCLISPAGKVVERLDTNIEGTLITRVPLLDDMTIYNRFGHYFPSVCLALIGIVMLKDRVRWFAKRRAA